MCDLLNVHAHFLIIIPTKLVFLSEWYSYYALAALDKIWNGTLDLKDNPETFPFW